MSESAKPNWKRSLQEVIFEADTPAGKWFDIILIIVILLSVATVMLDSIESIHIRYERLFDVLEWLFTILFTIEYILRLMCIGRPAKYATSFFGVVDFLGTIPTYVGLLIPGSHYLVAIRLLRILRIFRILKLVPYIGEARYLMQALKASKRKIEVFLFTVLILVTILGAMMYVVEGGKHGFDNIPKSIYWAIVTLTTVGYGDISPQTGLGQALAAVIMILGYSIIAVPTGFITVEFAKASNQPVSTQACPSCSAEGHDIDAKYCKYCGNLL